MGHETPFLLFLRPITGNEEEDPKKIDQRPKLAVKETEINYEDKETEMEWGQFPEHLTKKNE